MRPRLKAAFTLIELLVVIAIIAVLAGLALPVMSKVRDGADATACLSNLRQIGTGIASYVADNDGYLPGPLSQGQYTTWTSGGTKGSLGEKLEKYLSTAELKGTGTAKTATKTVMRCPSWGRVMPKEDAPVFVLNFDEVLLADSKTQPPWGDVEQDTKPVKLAVLENLPQRSAEQKTAVGAVALSRLWALKDADLVGFIGGGAVPAFAATLPETPVHGDFRNALFYDFHAGRLDLLDNPKP